MKTEKVEKVLAPIIQSDDSHVYVCGSAHMLEMSKVVMIEMATKFHVNKLIDEGRLHSDVFGALKPAGSAIGRRRRTASITQGIKDAVLSRRHPASARSRNQSMQPHLNFEFDDL